MRSPNKARGSKRRMIARRLSFMLVALILSAAPTKADVFYAVNAHATFETFAAEIAGLFSIDRNHDESSAQLHVESISPPELDHMSA